MRNNLIVFVFALSAIFLLSNNDGVPQPVTGSPGESGLSCNACHSGGNFKPTIEMKLLDANMQLVTKYEPGKLYNVSVKVKGENNPNYYGFQMVNLADADNSDKGLWSAFGSNVKQINLSVKQQPRKYVEQSGPKVDGEFLLKWTAPAQNTGKVTFYFSGLAANGDGDLTGDSHVVSKKSFEEMNGTSSTDNLGKQNGIKIFPNPSSNTIQIEGLENANIIIQSTMGVVVKTASTLNGTVDIMDLPKGLYIISTINDLGVKSYIGKFYKL